ncbi:hypothetical protein [Streptomyces afghaniensis]|uniref:hypothetical protein n=1 Tax=Streptomyces afghaniensis TaxID=66865 RepID=UPI00278195FA|nr:hypothetical protein [Streptomyces afghaniensis]MDQ1013596.1 hypothetical protein [Streptomyces afghaniensis]
MNAPNPLAKSIAAMAFGSLVLFATTPAQASAGWDYVGTKNFYPVENDWYQTGEIKSTGGDVKACITTASSSYYYYDLQEMDGAQWDLVDSVRGAGCWTWRDIGRWVDGSNNRAEFVIVTNDFNAKRVKWWD